MIEVAKQSSDRVSEHERRVNTECQQLLLDIRRIGLRGEPCVSFGELFDDEAAQQYYEALVGTLKSAKKQGLIHYQGQMLLKGVHDKVMISIAMDKKAAKPKTPSPPDGSSPKTVATFFPSNSHNPPPSGTRVNPPSVQPEAEEIECVHGPSAKKHQSVSPFIKTHPISLMKGPTATSTTPATRRINNSVTLRYPIKEKQSTPAGDNNVSGHSFGSACPDQKIQISPHRYSASGVGTKVGRRWVRRTQSTISVVSSKSPATALFGPVSVTLNSTKTRYEGTQNIEPQASDHITAQRPALPDLPSKDGGTKKKNFYTKKLRPPSERVLQPKHSVQNKAPTPEYTSPSSSARSLPVKEESSQEQHPLPAKESIPAVDPRSDSLVSPPKRSVPVKNYIGEVNDRVKDEVALLLGDIRRVGCSEQVTFGALFDDDQVQNTYEALVGTLRSAKKRGLVHYQGQMLLKGMHDEVIISITTKE